MLRTCYRFVVLMPVKVLGTLIKAVSMMEVPMRTELSNVVTEACRAYEIMAM